MEWASNRTLSIGRSYAKEILNTLRLSQSNRYAVCLACRGLSLEDSYWIRQDGDEKTWEEVNLFQNPLSLFITEVSLSGRNHHYKVDVQVNQTIHTPELHDHAFVSYDNVLSQTTEENKTLLEAAKEAQAELQMNLDKLFEIECPRLLGEKQWEEVLDRAKKIM